MVESHSGTPDAAVRSSNRPAPPDGRYLTGKKALGVPYAYGRWPFFLRPAAGHLRTAFILRCAAGDDEARHAGGAFLFQGMGAGF